MDCIVHGVTKGWTRLNDFHFTFFIMLCFSYFHHSVFQLTYPSFCFCYTLLLFPSSVYLISVITLFIIDCSFFNSSTSLSNISCTFLIYASNLFIYVSILFSRFWIIFTIIIMNYFSGRLLFPRCLLDLVGFYLVPSSAGYFSAFSFCFIFCIWDLLSEDWRVVVLLNCGICLPWVGLDPCLVKVSSLGGLVPVFWSTELNLVSLKGSVVSSSKFWGVSGFGMALGKLSANEQCCVSFLLKNCDGASRHWSLLAFGWAWFWCWYGGVWEGSCSLKFPGISNSLVDQSLGLWPPTSGVQAWPLL